VSQRRGPSGVSIETLEREIALLERRILDSARQLRSLRWRVRLAARARAEVAEIRDEWEELDTRWWVVVIAALVAFFLVSYLFYMNLGTRTAAACRRAPTGCWTSSRPST
jgi:hypothetical protein